MQTKFMYSDSSVHILRLNPETSTDILRPNIYSVQFNQMTGFYLDIVQAKLEIPKKIYGDMQEKVAKCITTYKSRKSSTGILLTGDKGTGKTLLMSILADQIMSELQIPIILIRTPFSGDQFDSFIQHIGECCLLFDEFGKMYSKSHNDEENTNQNTLLALLDGIDKTKRLIVLTENSELSINNYLLNRPSRIFYHFKYTKLDDSSIIDYCQYNKTGDKIQNGILDICHRSFSFSFDNLQSIVEDCKRFNTLPSEAVKDLNVDVANRPIYIEVISVEISDFGMHPDKDSKTKFKINDALIVKPNNEFDDNSKLSFIDISEKPQDYESMFTKKQREVLSHDLLKALRNVSATNRAIYVYLSASDLVYEDAHTLAYELDGYMVKANKTTKTPPRITYAY